MLLIGRAFPYAVISQTTGMSLAADHLTQAARADVLMSAASANCRVHGTHRSSLSVSESQEPRRTIFHLLCVFEDDRKRMAASAARENDRDVRMPTDGVSGLLQDIALHR